MDSINISTLLDEGQLLLITLSQRNLALSTRKPSSCLDREIASQPTKYSLFSSPSQPEETHYDPLNRFSNTNQKIKEQQKINRDIERPYCIRALQEKNKHLSSHSISNQSFQQTCPKAKAE